MLDDIDSFMLGISHYFIIVLCRSTDLSGGKIAEKEKWRQQSSTLPTTDADMLKAGTSFLDAIEKSLGLGYVRSKAV